MATALVASLLLIAAGSTATGIRAWAAALVGQIDFNETLLHGMLAFLLFAGALRLGPWRDGQREVDYWVARGTSDLHIYISGGVGCLRNLPLHRHWGGIDAVPPFRWLISPTDPIAVLAIMRRVGAPKRLEVQIAGESLFNYGVGIVIFMTLLKLSKGEATPEVADVLILLRPGSRRWHLAGLGCRAMDVLYAPQSR